MIFPAFRTTTTFGFGAWLSPERSRSGEVVNQTSEYTNFPHFFVVAIFPPVII
jgi:hypothetical protein